MAIGRQHKAIPVIESLAADMKLLMKSNALRLIPLILAVMIVTPGCSKETSKAIGDLSSLQSELSRYYEEKDIKVTIVNSRYLNIVFTNSKFNRLGQPERLEKAREIAIFAKNHYGSISLIQTINVAFMGRQDFLVFHRTEGVGSHRFETASLIEQEETSSRITVTYDPSARKTEVYSLRNLELYSKEGHGLFLVVHFDSPGDKVKKPKDLALDFTTEGSEKLFENDPAFLITADGRQIFSGTLKLKNSVDGGANQFLLGTIPYERFVTLTNSRAATMTLGSYEFAVKNEQIALFRAMKKCAEGGMCG